MGLMGWFKGNNEHSSNVIILLEKAISSGRKGQWAPESKFAEAITTLDLEAIDALIIPYYEKLSAHEKGLMRKALVEAGIVNVIRGYLLGKNRPKKTQVLKAILALKINPGTEDLVELIADKDDEIKWLATEMLQELLPKDGLDLLIDRLQQPTKYPPARISEILIKYGEVAIDKISKEIITKAEGAGYLIIVLGLLPMGKIYPIINEILKLQDEELIIKVLDTLAEKDEDEFQDLPEKTIDSLKEDFEQLLNTLNTSLKGKVVKILGNLPVVNYEILYQLTWDEHKLIRLSAFNGLRKGNEKAEIWLKKIKADQQHPLHDRLVKGALN